MASRPRQVDAVPAAGIMELRASFPHAAAVLTLTRARANVTYKGRVWWMLTHAALYCGAVAWSEIWKVKE